MENIKISRIRLFFRHITVRLMAVSFIAIVPLNILSMVLLQQIVNVYQERLLTSYQSQIELYASGLNAKLQYIDSAMNGYLDTAQILEFSHGPSGSEAVAYVRIYNDLKNIRMMADIPVVSFLIDNETELCSISTQPYKYNATGLEALKQSLAMQEEQPGSSGKYTAIETESGVFLQKRYDFNRYSMGFLINSQMLLDEIYSGMSGSSELVFIADSRGGLIDFYSRGEMPATWTENPPAASADISTSSFVIIEKQVPLMNHSILWVIPKDSLAEDVPELVGFLRILAIVSMLSLPLIWLLVSWLVLRPLIAVVKALGEIERGNFEYRLSGRTGSFQMDFIYHVVNHMAREIKSLTIESYEKEIAKLQTDSVNLRLQVRPHTLLNSLSTIYNLAQSGENKRVMEFSLNLISYFRYVLRQGEALVPIEGEMKFIQDYLELQRVRFPGSFESRCEMDPETAQLRIPPLIIENFVENAMKHALVMGSTIEIKVRVKKVQDKIIIDVEDSGCGMEAEKAIMLEEGKIVQDKLGDHIGVWNSRRRLKLYYGDNGVFKITSAPGQGTRVHMELPLEPQDVQVLMRDITDETLIK